MTIIFLPENLNQTMKKTVQFLIISAFCLSVTGSLTGQNPFIRDQFTADPSARVFNGRVYVYPSHDIPAPEDFARKDWFCMEDYHVFSSSNLSDWTDHGVIVSQENVNWVNAATYSMWAPDCIERNGKYFFYFPANVKPGSGRGFGIGVAVADRPEGPFTPQPEPIKGVVGIDPNVFIDHDGQAYIYWSQGNIFGAKLKENMLELDSEVSVIKDMPAKGLKEGPYLFERKGIYYMTYPHVQNRTERLEYAIGDNPMGPFKFAGVIMDESPTGCWTNHHSIIEYEGQWYLFYHHNDLSPKFDKNRSVRIDSLFFNEDGTIRKVIPTLRGVGLTDARGIIEIDRYSSISEKGAATAFLDSADTFKGWKLILSSPGSWVKYNSADFGKKKPRSVEITASSSTGGTLLLGAGNTGSPVISEINIPAGDGWNTVTARVKKLKPGVHNLVMTLKGEGVVEINCLSFK